MGARKIAQSLHIDRKTVKRIIEYKGDLPASSRKGKITVDEDLLRETFTRCDGWSERVHEILLKEHGVRIGYSTLTALIREFDLKNKKRDRSGRQPDLPGEEFQHDTSPYKIKINDTLTRVQASLTYYRYSKERYLKFYPSFTRFHMKCFFFEALSYFGYVPKTCIIDNTNLAVLHGTGKNAVMVPEMNAFAKQFGFEWMAHEIKHSNRKAGNERSFWTLETNFFPGRTFTSWEDLNRQAFIWCRERSIKPTTKQKIIPADAFEYEKAYMKKITLGITAPYRQHLRVIDQYGYIAFNANYYWIPSDHSGNVTILEYADKLKIYSKRKDVIEYALASSDIKNQRFAPEGVILRYRPKNKKVSSTEEEKRLRSMSGDIDQYLTLSLKTLGGYQTRHRFIKGVHALSRKVTNDIFNAAIVRALDYQIYNLQTLSNICSLIVQNESFTMPCPEIDFDFEKRESYLEGEWSDEPDLDEYKNRFLGDKDEET